MHVPAFQCESFPSRPQALAILHTPPQQQPSQNTPMNTAPSPSNSPMVMSARRVEDAAERDGVGVGMASVGTTGVAVVTGRAGAGVGAAVVAAGGAGVAELDVDAGAGAAGAAADPEPPVLSMVMAGMGFWRIVHPSTKVFTES